jgi:hypothetical protein
MVEAENDLTPAGPGARLVPLVDQAHQYAEQAKAPNTRRAYAADWAHFCAWCAREGLPSLCPHRPKGWRCI